MVHSTTATLSYVLQHWVISEKTYFLRETILWKRIPSDPRRNSHLDICNSSVVEVKNISPCRSTIPANKRLALGYKQKLGKANARPARRPSHGAPCDTQARPTLRFGWKSGESRSLRGTSNDVALDLGRHLYLVSYLNLPFSKGPSDRHQLDFGEISTWDMDAIAWINGGGFPSCSCRSRRTFLRIVFI